MSMVVYTRNLSTGHMESEGSEVEGHAQQHNKSRLAYMRPCLKKSETASYGLTSLVPAPGRQRQVDFCEFGLVEACL